MICEYLLQPGLLRVERRGRRLASQLNKTPSCFCQRHRPNAGLPGMFAVAIEAHAAELHICNRRDGTPLQFISGPMAPGVLLRAADALKLWLHLHPEQIREDCIAGGIGDLAGRQLFGRPIRKLKFLRRLELETSLGSDFELAPLTAKPDSIQDPGGLRCAVKLPAVSAMARHWSRRMMH